MAQSVAIMDEGDLPPLPAAKRGSPVILILVVLLLVVGGGAALYFTGIISPAKKATAASENTAEHDADAVRTAGQGGFFLDLPDMLVNLDEPGRQMRYLKLKISLEVDNSTEGTKVEAVLPRVVDRFQTFMRGLRIEDVQGGPGLERLRAELLQRVSEAAQPTPVRQVLFREILMQ